MSKTPDSTDFPHWENPRICCEKDPDYYAAAVERIKRETSQLRLAL